MQLISKAIFVVIAITVVAVIAGCTSSQNSLSGPPDNPREIVAEGNKTITEENKIVAEGNKIAQEDNGEKMGKDTNFTSISAEYINLLPARVKIGEQTSFAQTPALKIRLVDVTVDDRCPSDVACAQAGMATVLVEATLGNTTEKKTLDIWGGWPSTFRQPDKAGQTLGSLKYGTRIGSGNIISIGQYRIFLVALNPYPISTGKIEKSEYEAFFVADTEKSLEFKKNIVEVAKVELKKHLSNYDKYFATGITSEGGETFSAYTVTFGIPFGPADQAAQVKLEYKNDNWTATGFEKSGS